MDVVSPYALLCASKPKSVPTIVTPYDLYSAAHHPAHSDTMPEHQTRVIPPQAEQENLSIPSANPSSRSYHPSKTHYIRDIHERHNHVIAQACKRRSY